MFAVQIPPILQFFCGNRSKHKLTKALSKRKYVRKAEIGSVVKSSHRSVIADTDMDMGRKMTSFELRSSGKMEKMSVYNLIIFLMYAK